jgi:hypothetical protein
MSERMSKKIEGREKVKLRAKTGEESRVCKK